MNPGSVRPHDGREGRNAAPAMHNLLPAVNNHEITNVTSTYIKADGTVTYSRINVLKMSNCQQLILMTKIDRARCDRFCTHHL